MLCGCSSRQAAPDNTVSEESSKDAWTTEDFKVYDKDEKLYNYPFNSTLKFYDNLKGIRNYYEELGEKNLELHTKRGICAHASAKIVFENINLDSFEIRLSKWPYLGSLTDEQKKIEQDYLSKYTDKYQAVKHTTDLPEELSLYVLANFYDNGEGQLIPYPAGEGSYWSDQILSKDQYSLLCYIKNDYIFEWHIEHHEAYLTDEEYELYQKVSAKDYKATEEEYKKYIEITNKLFR
jgi:hypothetical protein